MSGEVPSPTDSQEPNTAAEALIQSDPVHWTRQLDTHPGLRFSKKTSPVEEFSSQEINTLLNGVAVVKAKLAIAAERPGSDLPERVAALIGSINTSVSMGFDASLENFQPSIFITRHGEDLDSNEKEAVLSGLFVGHLVLANYREAIDALSAIERVGPWRIAIELRTHIGTLLSIRKKYSDDQKNSLDRYLGLFELIWSDEHNTYISLAEANEGEDGLKRVRSALRELVERELRTEKQGIQKDIRERMLRNYRRLIDSPGTDFTELEESLRNFGVQLDIGIALAEGKAATSSGGALPTGLSPAQFVGSFYSGYRGQKIICDGTGKIGLRENNRARISNILIAYAMTKFAGQDLEPAFDAIFELEKLFSTELQLTGDIPKEPFATEHTSQETKTAAVLSYLNLSASELPAVMTSRKNGFPYASANWGIMWSKTEQKFVPYNVHTLVSQVLERILQEDLTDYEKQKLEEGLKHFKEFPGILRERIRTAAKAILKLDTEPGISAIPRDKLSEIVQTVLTKQTLPEYSDREGAFLKILWMGGPEHDKHFDTVHVLSIFKLLGIGAEFTSIEAWLNSLPTTKGMSLLISDRELQVTEIRLFGSERLNIRNVPVSPGITLTYRGEGWGGDQKSKNWQEIGFTFSPAELQRMLSETVS